ncbi:MAG: FAD:protein FMN transferase [Planctomycetes bacterium]|nr:FAD:protein FMN transferase [Planctomycetota bacterium]
MSDGGSLLPDLSGEAGLRTFAHFAMACDWLIAIPACESQPAESAAQAAFEEVDRLERELSRFRPDSDIARINALRSGESTQVGADAVECLALAASVHDETGGAFDVGVGALVGQVPQPPPPPVGMRCLRVAPAARTVMQTQAGVVIDLGAIGKGYAVDRAVEVLRDWKIAAALVHAGQSSVFGFSDDAQLSWRVGVRNPLDQASILGTVELRNESLSASGRRIHGSHIIDPRTRQPALRAIGAWARAGSAAVSDAVSTALMVMDDSEIAAFSARHAAIGCLHALEADGSLRLRELGDWIWSPSHNR